MNRFSGFLIDKKDGSLNGRFYALAYFVLAHAFFWKILVPGRVLFGTDIINQSYPIQHMAVQEMIKDRSLMLWNPYIFSGMPFLASFSFPFFYPPALLFFILPVGFAMGYEILLHIFLMGLFMYLLLRHLKLSRQAAFVGGLLFMFNAHFISLVYPGHGGKLFTMTYLPLALLFLDRAMDSKPFRNLTLMGLVIGLMFYGGHIQILFYCGIALLGFFLMRLLSGLKERGLLWGVKAAAGFAYAFMLGTMLYAAILFPAWQYRGYTGRAGGVTGAATYEFATSFSEPPEDLLYIPLRNPFGWGKDYGPDTPNTDGIFYRGRIGLRLSVDYFSVFGLVLAFIGVVFVRNRYTWYFLGLSLTAMFLALGMFNPYYLYVYKYIPGFSMFRIPYAIMIMVPACLSVLAAFGLDRLMTLKKKEAGKLDHVIAGGAGLGLLAMGAAFYWGMDPSRTIDRLLGHPWVREMLWEDFSDVGQRLQFFLKNVYFFVVLLAASMLVLFVYRRGWLKVKYLAAVSAALILLDLWPLGWDFVKTIPASALEGKYFRETGEIKTIEADGNDGRVFSMVNNNELLYRGIQALVGYHAVPLGYYEKLLSNISFENGIIDMLGAKYLMLPMEREYDFASYPDEAGRKRMLAKFEPLPGDGIYFYKNRGAGPRAWLVNRLSKAGSDDEALGIVSDPRFGPFREAVLTEDLPAGIALDPAADLSRQRIDVASYKPDRVEYTVSAPASALMVASEVWYPGWKAYVDGRQSRVFRADYALRGIPVPAGEHKVVLRFEPAAFKLGAAVSVATLLFLSAVVGLPLYRKWRDAGSD